MLGRFAAALFALTLCAPAGASAHAFLKRALPSEGGSVATPPPALDLFFTEAVAPHFSKVEVLDANGHPIRTGAIQVRSDGRELVVPVPKLAPGQYTVIWHVTAEDTHRTHGHYSFRIGR
ncbi:MAG: copper resistance CopC family protein [Acetobacteraceae bacterium]